MSFEFDAHVGGTGSIPRDVIAFLDNLGKEIGNGVGEEGDLVLTVISKAELKCKFSEIWWTECLGTWVVCCKMKVVSCKAIVSLGKPCG